MVKQVTQTLNERVNLTMLVKAMLVSYFITIPTFIIFAFILTYTNFPEKFISPVVIITTIISILTAGSTATRNLKSKGWLNGGMVGVIYMLVLYVVSSIVFKNFSVTSYVVTMAVVGMITGSIGGIVGINLKKGTHSRHNSL